MAPTTDDLLKLAFEPGDGDRKQIYRDIQRKFGQKFHDCIKNIESAVTTLSKPTNQKKTRETAAAKLVKNLQDAMSTKHMQNQPFTLMDYLPVNYLRIINEADECWHPRLFDKWVLINTIPNVVDKEFKDGLKQYQLWASRSIKPKQLQTTVEELNKKTSKLMKAGFHKIPLFLSDIENPGKPTTESIDSVVASLLALRWGAITDSDLKQFNRKKSNIDEGLILQKVRDRWNPNEGLGGDDSGNESPGDESPNEDSGEDDDPANEGFGEDDDPVNEGSGEDADPANEGSGEDADPANEGSGEDDDPAGEQYPENENEMAENRNSGNSDFEQCDSASGISEGSFDSDILEKLNSMRMLLRDKATFRSDVSRGKLSKELKLTAKRNPYNLEKTEDGWIVDVRKGPFKSFRVFLDIGVRKPFIDIINDYEGLGLTEEDIKTLHERFSSRRVNLLNDCKQAKKAGKPIVLKTKWATQVWRYFEDPDESVPVNYPPSYFGVVREGKSDKPITFSWSEMEASGQKMRPILEDWAREFVFKRNAYSKRFRISRETGRHPWEQREMTKSELKDDYPWMNRRRKLLVDHLPAEQDLRPHPLSGIQPPRKLPRYRKKSRSGKRHSSRDGTTSQTPHRSSRENAPSPSPRERSTRENSQMPHSSSREKTPSHSPRERSTRENSQTPHRSSRENSQTLHYSSREKTPHRSLRGGSQTLVDSEEDRGHPDSEEDDEDYSTRRVKTKSREEKVKGKGREKEKEEEKKKKGKGRKQERPPSEAYEMDWESPLDKRKLRQLAKDGERERREHREKERVRIEKERLGRENASEWRDTLRFGVMERARRDGGKRKRNSN